MEISSKMNNFSVVFSKSTTNRCATINVNGHADHNYWGPFLEMSIHQYRSVNLALTQMQMFWYWHVVLLWKSLMSHSVYSYLFIFYWERIEHWYFMFFFFNKTIIPLSLPGYGITLWPARHVQASIQRALAWNNC